MHVCSRGMFISLPSISLPMWQARSCYSNQMVLSHWSMEQRDLDVEAVLTACGYICIPTGTLHMHALIYPPL
jgi:hypothetical protein